MRIVFFGTPPFAAVILRTMIEKGMNVVGVISRPDKPQGRSRSPVPGAVRLVAEEHGIPHFQPEKVSSSEFFPTLQKFEADFFVVVAYGEILRQHVLDLPKVACVNVHASLLPKYRGAAPIQHAILHGEAESGITIMHMVRKMDAGDIITQAVIPISQEMTYGQLEMEMRTVSSDALFAALVMLEKGSAPRSEQDEAKATLAPKIELEDCLIDWGKSAQEIHNLVRGVNPEPGAWCTLKINEQEKRLKVYTAQVRNNTSLHPRECVLEASKHLIVGCEDGAIELLEVQLEGKKRMKASDFCRGLTSASWKFI